MNEPQMASQTVTIERVLRHPVEKVWRALTDSALLGQWLMSNDFQPVLDHQFRFTADWGGIDCKVMAVQQHKTLTYTWVAYGLETAVTWTLTPTDGGTHLRMEQTGFTPDRRQAYNGAKHGWKNFLEAFDRLLARIDEN